MSNLHIYFETGAVGDTCLNLCRAHAAMRHGGHDGVVVHTSPVFRFGNPPRTIPSSPDVKEILRRTNFIRDVVYEIDYSDAESFRTSKKYGCPIKQPMVFPSENDVRLYADLRDLTPDYDPSAKVALLQPVSLRFKPQDRIDDYIPVWDRCIRALREKAYEIVLVGGPEDPIHLTMSPSSLRECSSKVGSWSMLQSVAFCIYRADIVVACDSWAAIWGPAAKVKTAIAWGYRMESDIDFWVTGFLGNRDFYKHGWSSQKDYCDADLATYISKTIRERQNGHV
jgi:hypothetical protein